jgi:hypothetical protein
MAMKGFATNPMVRYVPLCRTTQKRLSNRFVILAVKEMDGLYTKV